MTRWQQANKCHACILEPFLVYFSGGEAGPLQVEFQNHILALVISIFLGSLEKKSGKAEFH